MENPRMVSVIIPTYKSNTTLKNAIDSVLSQTYENIEVIVVDDNNPDTEHRRTTEKIMKEYLENRKVVYIKHEKNKNGAAARNIAFKHSNGDYICFLDDDDIFLETKIQKQVEYLKTNNQYQAVYCWRYQNGDIIQNEKVGDLSAELLSLTFTPYTSSIMLRRTCYEELIGFDENYKRHQDYEFLLRFFERFKIGVLKEPLIEIKGNEVDNMLRGSELEQLKSQFLTQFLEHIERIDGEHKGFKRLVFARHYSSVFWSYCKQGKIGSALRVFFKYSNMCGYIFLKSILKNLLKYFNVKRKRLWWFNED